MSHKQNMPDYKNQMNHIRITWITSVIHESNLLITYEPHYF